MSVMFLTPVIVLILLNFCCERVCSSNEEAGPYYVNIQAVGRCPNLENLPIQFSTKLRKYNRTTYTYTTDFNVTEYGLDDTLFSKLYVAKKGNGDYKENFYFVKFDKICSTLKKLVPDFLKDVEKQVGAERSGVCPLPPGAYVLKDYRITLVDVVGLPVMFYGTFRADLHTYKRHDNGTEERICCFRMFYEIVPKRRRG